MLLEVNGKVNANDGVLAPKKWQTEEQDTGTQLTFLLSSKK